MYKRNLGAAAFSFRWRPWLHPSSAQAMWPTQIYPRNDDEIELIIRFIIDNHTSLQTVILSLWIDTKSRSSEFPTNVAPRLASLLLLSCTFVRFGLHLVTVDTLLLELLFRLVCTTNSLYGFWNPAVFGISQKNVEINISQSQYSTRPSAAVQLWPVVNHPNESICVVYDSAEYWGRKILRWKIYFIWVEWQTHKYWLKYWGY